MLHRRREVAEPPLDAPEGPEGLRLDVRIVRIRRGPDGRLEEGPGLRVVPEPRRDPPEMDPCREAVPLEAMVRGLERVPAGLPVRRGPGVRLPALLRGRPGEEELADEVVERVPLLRVLEDRDPDEPPELRDRRAEGLRGRRGPPQDREGPHDVLRGVVETVEDRVDDEPLR